MSNKKISSYATPVYSIEQQWELVAKFRDLLIRSAEEYPEAEHVQVQALPLMTLDTAQVGIPFRLENDIFGDPSPTLAKLELDWQSWNRRHDCTGFMDRNPNHRSPLEALNACFYNCLVPPPELLLAIRHVSSSYFDAAGTVTLEEAFFGKTKRKVGNYSARVHSEESEDARMRLMDIYFPEILNRSERAQEIVKWLRLDISPETLERMVNKTRAKKKAK